MNAAPRRVADTSKTVFAAGPSGEEVAVNQAQGVWLVRNYLLGHKIVFGEAQVTASPG